MLGFYEVELIRSTPAKGVTAEAKNQLYTGQEVRSEMSGWMTEADVLEVHVIRA